MRNRESDTSKILSATGLVKVLTRRSGRAADPRVDRAVANTIRLSIFARRREVEVMKLVGATNWFIRWPFVIEGVIVGFMGGVLAVLLLAIAKDDGRRPARRTASPCSPRRTRSTSRCCVLLLLACMAVSALGSGITLRRFLRV